MRKPSLFDNKFRKNRLSMAVSGLVTFGTAIAFSGFTHAQGNNESLNLEEEVVVTGTRLQTRDGMVTATPVTSVDSAQLEAMMPGNLVEGLGQLPQFFSNEGLNSNQHSNLWFERGSFGALNLRGLGINRTLTLLDGRRVISSTAFGGVDVNIFPEAMLKSVETVTGGASAAYGTDAVAGVVNFLLDTNFEGFEAKIQAGETDRGDGGNNEFSLAFGTDIGEKAHFQISYEKAEQDPIQSYEGRDWYQGWGTVRDANDVLQVVPNVVTSATSYNGLIFAPGTPLQGLQFSRDGLSASPYIRSDIATATPVGVPPSNQSITNGGSGDDINSQNANLMPEFSRDALFVYADYDISDNFKVYGQFIRSTNESWFYNIPGGSFQGTPTALTIFQDNAYLPEDVQQIMVDNDIESFVFRKMGSMSDTLGQSYVATETDMQSFTGGFEFNVDSGAFEGWTVDGYFQVGESERIGKQHGLRVDRIFAAIDAVDNGSGEIVCRTNLFDPDAFPGCVPVNLFGQGNASAAGIDYIMGFEPGQQITTDLYFAGLGFAPGKEYSYTTSAEKRNITNLDQEVFEISANGEVSEGWGAGPIDMAIGYSKRTDEIYQVVQDVTNPTSNHTQPGAYTPVLCNDPDIGLRGVNGPDCANTVGVQYSKVANILGEITVDEFFVETRIPLFSDLPGIESMTTNLATRWADYSGSGEVWAWKAGLDWQVIPQLRARTTISRDVRAANLSERFDQTGSSAAITDPVLNTGYNATVIAGGNPDVAPEEADTLTYGLVYQPTDELAFSIDRYEVDIDGSIGNLTPQGVINACQAGDTAACARITRDGTTNAIILVSDQFVNIDQEIVSGIDLEASYTTNVDWFGDADEQFSARAFVTYLEERSETSGGAAKIDRAGQTGFESSTNRAYALPDYKVTTQLTYSYGGFSGFLQNRYISSGRNENSPPPTFVLSEDKVDSAFYTDLNLSYTHDLDRTSIEVFGNITNLFDVDPPVSASYEIFQSRAFQANQALFDVLGRRFTLGARVKF